ncbi:Malectin [Gracilaria domingensis]|nr:Malectin [Gracilaria domingensis]
MRLAASTLLFFGLWIALSSLSVVAQDDFGQLLLQAFTTGTLPTAGGSSPPVDAAPASRPEGFPSVTLEPLPQSTAEELSELQGTPELEPNELLDRATETPSPVVSPVDASSIDNLVSGNPDEVVFQIQSSSTPLPSVVPTLTPSPSASASPSPETGMRNAESVPAETVSPTETSTSETTPVEQSPAPMVVATPQPEIGGSFTQSLDFPNNSSMSSTAIFTTIKVNCGGMEERSSLNEEKTKWYNVDSQIAEDPYAAAHFISDIDALLYSSYRYAETQVTYDIDLPEPGRWLVVLQWAEISQFYMREGARVFSVRLNSVEKEADIDIYRDSPQGKFSPLVRSYEVDSPDSTLLIEINKKVGQPMLSAFQVSYVGPSTA